MVNYVYHTLVYCYLVRNYSPKDRFSNS